MEIRTKEKALENQNSNHQLVSAHTQVGTPETPQVTSNLAVYMQINCILILLEALKKKVMEKTDYVDSTIADMLTKNKLVTALNKPDHSLKKSRKRIPGSTVTFLLFS